MKWWWMSKTHMPQIGMIWSLITGWCSLQRRHIIETILLFTQANYLSCSQVSYDTKSEGKMTQHFRVVVILLPEIRFKWKLGTYRISSKIISELKGIVLVEVIEAIGPVGKLIIGKLIKVIWSVTPLSKIQSLVNTKLIKASGKGDRHVTLA